MAKVRILPDRVANQIAAGEVIERPAAVVKELVENALDAGATRIEVEFRNGGRALMRVEDNGHGMSRDDALLALERHATSKIVEATDLDRLASYGFRGEALPSIASVSRFELQTREAGSEVGTEILVNGGKFVHVRDCGRPVGTRIEVTHLFNSVPARRKFLKSDQTEAAHIVHCVRLYALACPGAAFTLIEDGRTIFRSPECRTLEERIAEIFGRQIAESLVTIECNEPGLRLAGLIGRPGVGRATRHEMIVFVNARPVDSRTLNYALIESYSESLPKGRYPLAFVFFECSPAAVDVNVHPAKREVRFRSEAQVRGFVIRAVLQRLRELAVGAGTGTIADFGLRSAEFSSSGTETSKPTGNGQPESASRAEAADRKPETREWRPLTGEWKPNPRERTPDERAQEGFPLHRTHLSGLRIGSNFPGSDFRSVSSAPASGFRPAVAPPPSSLSADPPPAIRNPQLSSWRFIGLAHGNYALFETAAGIVLLDRRAAHERVWFERLREQFRAGNVSSQRLLLPVPIELDAIAAALLIDRLSFLQGFGFEVGEFGRNFFRVESVPVWMEPADAESFLRDLLGAFRDGSLPDHNTELAREELARLAAARAVRLPENTSEAELRSLLIELFRTRSPLTSPAGRPTYIELNHSELARRFQR